MAMTESRTCTRCKTHVAWESGHRPEGCPTCMAEWEGRRDVDDMTVEERVTEFDSWGPVLEIPWPMFHQRMQELVGRPIYTHEFAKPELLRSEIQTGNSPDLEGVLAKLPADKPVFPVGDPESVENARRAAESMRRFADSIPEGIDDDGPPRAGR